MIRTNTAKCLCLAGALFLLSVAPLSAEETPTTPPPSTGQSVDQDGVAEKGAQNNEGDRDWGRDDGIAVGLSTTSKVIVGAGFLVIVGLVGWMVFHQKPDGTVHPYEEG